VNDKKVVSKPHLAVYLGLFIKSCRFPCKCDSDFGTKQDFKDHIVNGNEKIVRFNDLWKYTFANNNEMEMQMNTFHKHPNPPKCYKKL